VITASDAGGKSYFESVSDAAPSFAELWASAPSDPLVLAAPSQGGATQLEPAPGGSSWRIFELPDDAVVARYLRDQGVPGVDASGFHRTRTLDYVMILDGEVTLELDHGSLTLGPGDCVVQRATNHAWRNKSGKSVRMAVVMLGLAE
jgi:mannose-6-phosphate isomerase-like protein (cupin superfamily)